MSIQGLLISTLFVLGISSRIHSKNTNYALYDRGDVNRMYDRYFLMVGFTEDGAYNGACTGTFIEIDPSRIQGCGQTEKKYAFILANHCILENTVRFIIGTPKRGKKEYCDPVIREASERDKKRINNSTTEKQYSLDSEWLPKKDSFAPIAHINTLSRVSPKSSDKKNIQLQGIPVDPKNFLRGDKINFRAQEPGSYQVFFNINDYSKVGKMDETTVLLNKKIHQYVCADTAVVYFTEKEFKSIDHAYKWYQKQETGIHTFKPADANYRMHDKAPVVYAGFQHGCNPVQLKCSYRDFPTFYPQTGNPDDRWFLNNNFECDIPIEYDFEGTSGTAVIDNQGNFTGVFEGRNPDTKRRRYNHLDIENFTCDGEIDFSGWDQYAFISNPDTNDSLNKELKGREVAVFRNSNGCIEDKDKNIISVKKNANTPTPARESTIRE